MARGPGSMVGEGKPRNRAWECRHARPAVAPQGGDVVFAQGGRARPRAPPGVWSAVRGAPRRLGCILREWVSVPTPSPRSTSPTGATSTTGPPRRSPCSVIASWCARTSRWTRTWRRSSGGATPCSSTAGCTRACGRRAGCSRRSISPACRCRTSGWATTWSRARVFQHLSWKIGAFLVRRPANRKEMLESARQLRDDVLSFLAHGLDVMVFPEGTRKNIPEHARYGDFFPTAFDAALEYARNREPHPREQPRPCGPRGLHRAVQRGLHPGARGRGDGRRRDAASRARCTCSTRSR